MDDNNMKVYEYISNKTCTLTFFFCCKLAYINLHYKKNMNCMMKWRQYLKMTKLYDIK